MYPTPINEKKFGILNETQAETLTIFANHFGVSLSYLQSSDGKYLDALCYELAKKLSESLARNFAYEQVSDLARAYKALAYGGSI